METQHPSNPDGYTKLNDTADETNPNVQFSFEQKDSEEANARHRTFTSGNEAPNPDSTAQDSPNTSSQPQRKELSSVFSFFYGASMVLGILFNGFGLIGMIALASKGLGFDKFEFFIAGWFVAQCIIAFLGLWNKDCGKIEKAFTMMKIYFPLTVVSFLGRLFEAIATQQRYRTRGGNLVSETFGVGIMSLVGFTLLVFLPTRKARNTLKVTPEEEEMRREKAEDTDPIEKLEALKFTIYKYVLLISFCLDLKGLVSGVYDDFSDLPKFLGRILSKVSFFTTEISGYIVIPLGMISTFLAFEGLRRKNLDKTLSSIKVMKIDLVMRVIFLLISTMAGHFEGTLKERYQKVNSSGTLEIEDEWMLLVYFGFITALSALMSYIFIYLTSQVRDILKAHQKSKHTL